MGGAAWRHAKQRIGRMRAGAGARAPWCVMMHTSMMDEEQDGQAGDIYMWHHMAAAAAAEAHRALIVTAVTAVIWMQQGWGHMGERH